MNFQKYENLDFLAEEAGFACIASPFQGVGARYQVGQARHLSYAILKLKLVSN